MNATDQSIRKKFAKDADLPLERQKTRMRAFARSQDYLAEASIVNSLCHLGHESRSVDGAGAILAMVARQWGYEMDVWDRHKYPGLTDGILREVGLDVLVKAADAWLPRIILQKQAAAFANLSCANVPRT